MSESEEASIEGQEESALDPAMLIHDDGDETQDDAVAEPSATETDDTAADQEGEATEAATQPADGGDVEPIDDLRQRQEQAVLRIEKAAATWENAVNRARNNPTEQNIKAAEKAKSGLDTLLEADDLDLEPGKHLKALAGEFKQAQDQYALNQQSLAQQIQQMVESQTIARTAPIQDMLLRMQLESEHPHLKGKYDSLVKQAHQQLQTKYGDMLERLQPQDYSRLAAQEWQAVLGEAVKQAPPVETPKASPPVKPKATQPIKSKSGSSRPQSDPDARLKQVLDSFIDDD